MSDLDRITRALKSLIREVFPRIDYLGSYEYRIVTQSGNLFDLQPTDKSLGLPDLASVPPRSGVAGARVTAVTGTTVLVSFVNSDPAKPFISWFESWSLDGFKPDEIHFEANGAPSASGVARIGDAVSGMITGTSVSGGAVSGTFSGTITSGNTKVFA